MSKTVPRKNRKSNQYEGYVVEVTTSSSSAYPERVIRRALNSFAGMKVSVSEKPGMGRPRLKSLSTPRRARFGKVFVNGKEIPRFGETALCYGIQRTLSQIKARS
jgi:hypothetical protein